MAVPLPPFSGRLEQCLGLMEAIVPVGRDFRRTRRTFILLTQKPFIP